MKSSIIMIKGFKRKNIMPSFVNYKIQNYYDSSRSVIFNQKKYIFDPKNTSIARNFYKYSQIHVY